MRTVTLHCPGSDVRIGAVRVAESAWDRTRGLLGRPRLLGDEGMLLMRCNSVHTVGMRYPIDVVFLGAEGRIERLVEALAPMRLAGCRKAKSVLELHGGQARRLRLRPGMQLTGW